MLSSVKTGPESLEKGRVEPGRAGSQASTSSTDIASVEVHREMDEFGEVESIGGGVPSTDCCGFAEVQRTAAELIEGLSRR